MHKILIDGAWVDALTDVPRDIKNPATLKPLGTVADCGAADVARAVAAARAAQSGWARTPVRERTVLLATIGGRIRAQRQAFATLLTLETGKPLPESLDCVDWTAACFEGYARLDGEPDVNAIARDALAPGELTLEHPYGVVAAIVPFNFPLLLMACKVAPALAAGNTVVAKPPHQNPLTNLKLAELYDALPPGVINVITGGPETGAALADHPGVDMIAFTGSTAVGRKIAAAAGAQLKRVHLELGSIDPFIVCRDADLEVAVPGIAWSRLQNAGQACTASKRIYVERVILSDFLTRLHEHVGFLEVGDPIKPDTDVGPLISLEAARRVEDQVARAMREGATLVLGGRGFRPAGLPGHFFQPTILTDVRHGSVATREEIFGPVFSITPVADVEEAIRQAVDAGPGLNAGIYPADLTVALQAARSIRADAFWINDAQAAPFAATGGRMSLGGLDRSPEASLEAFQAATRVHLEPVMTRKPWWFPYRDRREPEGGASR